jgi:hypothetical protein
VLVSIGYSLMVGAELDEAWFGNKIPPDKASVGARENADESRGTPTA